MGLLNRLGQEIIIDAEYVKFRLDDAGEALMALPGTGTLPASYRVAWPVWGPDEDDAMSEREDAEEQRVSPPSASRITDMDTVFFDWIPLLGEAVVTRKILLLRSLIRPATGKRVWTLRRLEGRFGVNKDTIRSRYEAGVGRIVTRLNRPEWVEKIGSQLP